MAKIHKLMVGESLVGDGNEVAHIDLIIGPRGSAAESAFANALVNNKDGFTALLAVVRQSGASLHRHVQQSDDQNANRRADLARAARSRQGSRGRVAVARFAEAEATSSSASASSSTGIGRRQEDATTTIRRSRNQSSGRSTASRRRRGRQPARRRQASVQPLSELAVDRVAPI